MIKGITVKLHIKERTGVDDFDRSIYKDSTIEVENVLITPASTTDIVNAQDIFGKKIEYVLCIPKGDQNSWIDTVVEFFGEKFHTVGYPEELIEEMTPLNWNKKVKVERYG